MHYTCLAIVDQRSGVRTHVCAQSPTCVTPKGHSLHMCIYVCMIIFSQLEHLCSPTVYVPNGRVSPCYTFHCQLRIYYVRNYIHSFHTPCIIYIVYSTMYIIQYPACGNCFMPHAVIAVEWKFILVFRHSVLVVN